MDSITTEVELAEVVIESIVDRDHSFLYLHLPDGTLVFDARTSKIVGSPVWYKLSSSIEGNGIYLARNFVWCYDRWLFGNPVNGNIGTFDHSIGSHYGIPVLWEFQTQIIYNESRGAIFHELELMCLTGVSANDSVIWTDYSNDQGVTWSNPKSRKIGKYGRRDTRINWLQCGTMNDRRIQRFSGTSDSHLTISCLEARIEPLL